MSRIIEYIEESKSWTCPRDGEWKVICVGGGALTYDFQYASTDSSGSTSITYYSSSGTGKTTSFGSYLSASGGGVSYNERHGYTSLCFNGYTMFEYGEPICVSIDSKAFGTGYGASANEASNYSRVPFPGDMKVGYVDLSEGDVIACTVGTGAIPPENNKFTSSNGSTIEYRYNRNIKARDGVIILEYMG